MMKEDKIKLSKLSESLEASRILQYSNTVKAMKAGRMTFQNYTVGDFDPSIFPIPVELKIEVIKAFSQDYTNYPAAEGNSDLRLSIARFEREFSGIGYEPDEVIVGSG